MKFKFLPLIILFTIALTSGCSEKTSEPEPQAPSEPHGISGKVDGATWKATYFEASYANNIISIEGHADDGSFIKIQFVATGGKGVGSHQIFPNSSLNYINYTTSGGQLYSTKNYNETDPVPGNVKISKMDDASKILNGTCQTKVIGGNSEELTIDISIDNITYTTK